MTLRDALVALAERLRTPLSDDECTQYTMGKRTGRHNAAEMLEAVIAAHPAVEGDMEAIATRMGEVFAEHALDGDAPAHKVTLLALRAALDAAWPGMVADAERYRWIRKHCDVIEACDETILGWIFQNNGASKLDDWIDRRKAMEASRG